VEVAPALSPGVHVGASGSPRKGLKIPVTRAQVKASGLSLEQLQLGEPITPVAELSQGDSTPPTWLGNPLYLQSGDSSVQGTAWQTAAATHKPSASPVGGTERSLGQRFGA
jgi:hypothetical protein